MTDIEDRGERLFIFSENLESILELSNEIYIIRNIKNLKIFRNLYYEKIFEY